MTTQGSAYNFNSRYASGCLVAGARFERAMHVAYETHVVARPYPRQTVGCEVTESNRPLGL